MLAIVAAVVLTQFLGGRQEAAASLLTLTPPENIYYGSRLDIAAIARDEDFQEIYGPDLDAEGALEGWVGSLEIDPALLASALAVNQAEGKWDGQRLYILEGDFEFADLRADLEDLEYEETSYREYEVWEHRGGRDYYALVGEGQYVLRSDSEDAVKAALNSLYREVSLANAEDSDLKRVLDKVGSATRVWFFNEDWCEIKRCQGYGIAFSGYDAVAEEIPVTFVLLFSSAQAAERAADEYDEVATFVEEGITFDDGNIDIADIASDGEFVVGSGKYVPAEPAAVVPAPPEPVVAPAMPAAMPTMPAPAAPVAAPASPTRAPAVYWVRMPDYLSVLKHSLYVSDGALPDYLESGDLDVASLGESPAAVSLYSVSRLVWTIVFVNAEPSANSYLPVYGGLACFDWYGNEQFYIPSDTDLLIEEAFVIQHYNNSIELAQYNPGFCEWVIEDQNGGYIAGLEFELVP